MIEIIPGTIEIIVPTLKEASICHYGIVGYFYSIIVHLFACIGGLCIIYWLINKLKIVEGEDD